MSLVIHKSGNFSVEKGRLVALEGSKPESMLLLLQGKLDAYISSPEKAPPVVFGDLVQKSYRLFEMDQNIFICVNDLLKAETSSLTVAAASDCSLFAYEAGDTQTLMNLIHNQKDYGAYVINSISSLINSSYQAFVNIHSYCLMIEKLYNNLSVYYSALQEQYFDPVECDISRKGTTLLAEYKKNEIQVPVYFSKQFIEAQSADSVESCPEVSELKEYTQYYTHLFNVPPEISKAFFAADRYITHKHIAESSACLNLLLDKLSQTVGRLEKALTMLYDDSSENAYKAFFDAATRMRDDCLDCSPALDAFTYIYEKLKEISSYIEFEYRHSIGIDFEYLEHAHKGCIASIIERPSKLSDNSSASADIGSHNTLPEELIDSATKILKYSGVSEDKVISFMMNLTAFRNLKDRLSNDETVRAIRNAIAEQYFEIYQEVFRRAERTKDQSRLIRMFLSYGYMDEKLLDYDQIMAIYKLAGMSYDTGVANVYFMHEWLEKIYSMEKDPSINNLGQDYHDTFRELKKRGKLTEEDKLSYNNDIEGRLSFEITHMLRMNHKICHGQIAFYFPILHKDMAPLNPSRSVVTPELICEKLGRILEIDYSAFHREIYYKDPSGTIEKEIVMMQVIPDIILIPVYGTRALMLQEITGRHRDSPGRLVLPVFTDEKLDDMLLTLVGNFRWELCRTMMGSAWNNIAQSSLTSEYADYIQFYRKNRDLTEDAKEKVKSLITRYNNRLRDIFTSDYKIWINSESKGNPRLNKVARSIFFKFCPFSKDIRNQLEKQPIYTDLIRQTNFQKTRQSKELENRYKHYLKGNSTLHPVLMKNLEFYQDM
ncbi:MAG: hypothetical protein GXY17_06455 [Clostridiaceae bacterium]|nr:hypothetical protein [Clostridiaceae bacterium]